MKRLAVGAALITALLAIVGFLVFRSIAVLINDTAQVAHTHRVIAVLSETMSLLKDAESSQRGYVITGQAQYLEPYYTALPALDNRLDTLRVLTADNPLQQEQLEKLESAVKARISIMRSVVDARQRRGFASAQQLVLSGQGQRETNVVRARIEQMDSVERELLNSRSKRAQKSATLALRETTGGLLLSVLIIFLMLNLVRRENQRRVQVEAGLAAANQQLQHSLEAMERLSLEMTLIASTAELLQSCRTSGEAFPIIQRALKQLLPDASCAMALINASQNLVEVVVETQSSSLDGPARLPHRSLFSPDDCWALRRGQYHLVRDPGTDILCPHLHPAKSGDSDTADVASVCIPLIAQGNTLGVVIVRGSQEQPPAEADIPAARAMSEHIALALANLQLQEELRIQSIRDPLSGLFNRRYLEASLEREMMRSQRHKHSLSVIMIDIDFFKKLNDSYGHEAGDLVLREFGALLQSHCRGEDIACRYGGEEFIIILPEAPLDVAQQRAELLRECVPALRINFHRELLTPVTISCGVAESPVHGESRDELLRAADAALYLAKQQGRNQVVVASRDEV